MELWLVAVFMIVSFVAGALLGLQIARTRAKRARQMPLLGVVLPPEGGAR